MGSILYIFWDGFGSGSVVIAAPIYGSASFVFSTPGYLEAAAVASLVFVDAIGDGMNRTGAVAMGVDL